MEILDFTNPNTEGLFENLRGWLRIEDFSKKTGFERATIYGWKCNAKRKRIPQEMFVKLGGRVFIRTEVFKTWVSSQNPDLDWSEV